MNAFHDEDSVVKRGAVRAQAKKLTTRDTMGFMKEIILKDSERRWL
jgi:hypothetical protein